MKLPSLGATSDVPEAQPTGPTSPSQDRDTALDADARQGMPAPLPASGPSEGELQARADVEEAIAEGRAVVAERAVCLTCEGTGWIPGGTNGGLFGRVCPSCGGVRPSRR